MLDSVLIFMALAVSLGVLANIRHGLTLENLPSDAQPGQIDPAPYIRCLVLVPLSMLISMVFLNVVNKSFFLSTTQQIFWAIGIQALLQLIITLDLINNIQNAGHSAVGFLELHPRRLILSLWRALYLILPVTFMILVFSAIWQMYLVSVGYEPKQQELVTLLPQLGPSPALALLIFVAVIVAPVYEEIVFRRMLMPYLVSSLGLNGAIIISSLAFGLIHFNMSAVVPLTLLGIVFCWIYLKTRSLWASIFLHAFFNLLTVIASLMHVPV